jgi:hypothetical protein
MHYKVDKFTLGEAQDAELVVKFPDNVLVVDDAHKQTFITRPGGLKEFQDYYDPATGKTVKPPAKPSTTQAAQGS